MRDIMTGKITARLTKIFQKACYESSPEMALAVWQSVIAREKRAARIKLRAFALLGFLSLAGLIPTLSLLWRDLAQSGFYGYSSLIFSDSGSILSHWKELGFSLAESLPTLSIVSSLTLIFIFCLSLKYAAKQTFRNQLPLSGTVALSY